MKAKLTPVAYPTTKEEEDKWGFDVYKPEGTPGAWVLDWPSACVGFGLSPERTVEVAAFKVSEDLSQLSSDEVFAAHAHMFKLQWHTIFKVVESIYGVDGAIKVARGLGDPLGERGWKLVMERFGCPVPVDKFPWYQDVAHLFYGPDTQAYAWCDDRKGVCTRARCLFRPPKGMEAQAKYCRAFDTAYIEAYMRVDPDLICIRVPDLTDDGSGPKCVHMWTYDKTVVEKLPEELKRRIADSTKEILRGKGVKI